MSFLFREINSGISDIYATGKSDMGGWITVSIMPDRTDKAILNFEF